MHEYLFDVSLFAAIRVTAESEEEARDMLMQYINCSNANLGAWPNGDPIMAEVSFHNSEDAELVSVDDEEVDDNPFHPESPEGRAWDRGEMRLDGSLK